MRILSQILFVFIALSILKEADLREQRVGSIDALSARSSEKYCVFRQSHDQELRAALLQNDIQRACDLIKAGANVGLRIQPVYPDLDLMPEEFVQEVRLSKQPTLLMFAVVQGQRPVVDALLKRGACVNARGDYLFADSGGSDARFYTWLRGGTALHLAAYKGDFAMMDRLLRAKARVDVRDADGRTALSWAVEKSRGSVVSRLLQAHCNVNCVDNRGRSALQEAAEAGNPALYKQLKHAGATGSYVIRSDRMNLKVLKNANQKGR